MHWKHCNVSKIFSAWCCAGTELFFLLSTFFVSNSKLGPLRVIFFTSFQGAASLWDSETLGSFEFLLYPTFTASLWGFVTLYSFQSGVSSETDWNCSPGLHGDHKSSPSPTIHRQRQIIRQRQRQLFTISHHSYTRMHSSSSSPSS